MLEPCDDEEVLEMQCSQCGSENTEDARFCGICGATIMASIETNSVIGAVAPAVAYGMNSVPADGAIMPDPNKNKRLIITACVCAVIVVVAIVFAAVWQSVQEGNRRAAQPHKITVSIQASGYSDSDTRIPVQATGTSYNDTSIDGLFFVNAAGEGIELPKGEYKLAIPASPLTQDGILYKVLVEEVDLVVPEDTEDSASVDASQASTLKMEKGTALDETDADINKAYEYATKDSGQADKANQLKEKADKVHNDAVAQQAKEKKISQGLYYECPYYIIDLPESMAGQAWIKVVSESLPIANQPGFNGKKGWGVGYEAYIMAGPRGSDNYQGIEVVTYYNWSLQCDAELVKKETSKPGYTVEVLEWYPYYETAKQLNKYAQYVTAL